MIETHSCEKVWCYLLDHVLNGGVWKLPFDMRGPLQACDCDHSTEAIQVNHEGHIGAQQCTSQTEFDNLALTIQDGWFMSGQGSHRAEHDKMNDPSDHTNFSF